MVILSTLLFFTGTFLSIAIAVVVAWMALQKYSVQRDDEARREQPGEDRPVLFRSERLSTISIWNQLLERFDFIAILKTRIEQADLEWSVGRVTSLMLLCGTVALAVLVNLSWVPLWAALLGGAAAVWAPYGYILRRRARRFRRFQEHFPDVLDSLARALRAGYPFAAALEMVSGECAPPVSGEILKAAVEASLGMSWNQALDNLCQRMPLLEVNLFAAAVQLHARTGGRLSEVMGSLAENMREQIALIGEVRAIAAHGKLTGVILTIVPVAIAAIMMVVSPTYMNTLFDHPYGKHLIWSAVVCLVLAHLVIGRIVDLKA